tara:strand:- start:46 stop:336 length:291 start_codon:yes stop_codon:yes gene_type:complete
MKLRAINDVIIVRPADDDNVTASGIVIASSTKAMPTKGVVIAVGPGKTNSRGVVKPLDVEEGETIIFVKGTGETIKLKGETLVFLKPEHIIAKEGE